GRRSQYCGPTDSPKHTKFCHDRSSVLIVTITWRTCVAFFHYNVSQSRKEHSHLLSIRCDALPIILVGHVGPCRSDTDGFGCYPIRVADIVGPSGCIPEGPPRVPRRFDRGLPEQAR